MRRVVVHVDRLVLRGIDRHDAAALAAGLTAELQRQLARPGAAQALADAGNRREVRAGPVRVAPGTGLGTVGAAGAASIAGRRGS